MKRPIEAYFQNNSETKSKSFLHRYIIMFGRHVSFFHWCVVLFLIFLYVSYIALCMTWTLLGAIINPNYLLPYAAATFTFLIFVASKLKEFQETIEKGKEEILGFIEKTYGGFISKILIKMGINLMKIENDVLYKSKEITDSHGFQSTTRKLVESGVVKKEDLESVTKKISDLDSTNLNTDIIHLADHVASHPEALKEEFDAFSLKIVNIH